MANPAAVAATAQSQQAVQSSIVTLMQPALESAWGIIQPDNPASLDDYITAVQALTTRFGKMSATHAALAYDAERKAAGIPSPFNAKPAPPANLAKVTTSIRWATQDLYTDTPNVPAAKTKVKGVTDKNVIDAGRETIIGNVHADRKAKGWARETEPGCCAFCALLATRGAVYKSEDSADFQSHDHCRCFAVPVFTAYEPTAQVRDWQRLYRESTKGAHGPAASRAAFRKAFDSK